MRTRLLLLSAWLALSGCASVVTADGERLALTSAAFRAYVERVFREQNRLADELAFALDIGPARELLIVLSGLLTVASAGAYLVAWTRHMGRHGEGGPNAGQ